MKYLFGLLTFLTLVEKAELWFLCPDKDCQVSSWTSWTSCSASCGNSGRKSRSRHVTRKQECSGKHCPRLSESTGCNRVCCPVNCIYSWGAWSSCKGCGSNGEQTSLRVISQNAKCGGTCNVPSSRKRTCDTGK